MTRCMVCDSKKNPSMSTLYCHNAIQLIKKLVENGNEICQRIQPYIYKHLAIVMYNFHYIYSKHFHYSYTPLHHQKLSEILLFEQR